MAERLIFAGAFADFYSMTVSLRGRILFAVAAIAVVVLLILFARPGKKRAVHRGFYYWKTAYRLTDFERRSLDSLSARDLYLRLFDVGVGPDGRPQPVAIAALPARADSGFRYVPVIYITTEVLQQTSETGIRLLATQINTLSAYLMERFGPVCDEVQIDCDWTAGTRKTYFLLLKLLKEQSFFTGKKLSCTIRLHQVKYTLRNGIPPVDRGLLMCYNLGDLRRPGDHNSILQAGVAKEYLENISGYPLPLDVALPIFDWAVQFRGNAFSGILRGLPPEAIAGSGLFAKSSKRIYRSRYDTVWMGYEFRKDDVVRMENPEPAEVLSVAKYIAQRRSDTAMRVLLFHADSLLLSKHPVHELEAVFDAFR